MRSCYRFLFAGAMFGGNTSLFGSMREVVSARRDIQSTWLLMESPPREFITRIPPISWNWTLKGGLSMRSRVLAEERAGARFDAAFFNHLIPAIFLNQFRKRVPSIIAMDATPNLLHMYGKWYAVAPASKVRLVEKFKYTLARNTYQDAEYLMPCSHVVADSLRRDYGIPNEKIRMTPEGINLAKWTPPPRLRDLQRPVRVLFIGGDFIRKGGDLVLRLAAREEFRRCEFHLLSHDEFRSSSGNVVAHSNIAPNSDDLRRLYARCDVFLLPSRGDLSPVAILEAMAMELPVISTDVGGIKELVDDGITGFVIPPDREEAIASHLGVLVNNGSLRRRFGKAARVAVERRFNLERSISTIIDHLARVADAAAGRRVSIVQAVILWVALSPSHSMTDTLDFCLSTISTALTWL